MRIWQWIPGHSASRLVPGSEKGGRGSESRIVYSMFLFFFLGFGADSYEMDDEWW